MFIIRRMIFMILYICFYGVDWEKLFDILKKNKTLIYRQTNSENTYLNIFKKFFWPSKFLRNSLRTSRDI